MTIYIATDGEYSDYHIKAVFTDEKQAKLYCATHNCYLEEYEADEVKISTENSPLILWRARFNYSGLYSISDGYFTFQNEEYFRETFAEVTLDASIDREKAKKIIAEKHAKWKAQQQNI